MGAARKETRRVGLLYPDGRAGVAEFILDYEGAYERGSVALTCKLENRVLASHADDFFDALCEIRRELEREGIRLDCYGASRNVWPSGMQRDMRLGNTALRFYEGKDSRREDMISIWETGPDVEPVTVSEQSESFERWFAERRDPKRA